VSHGGVAAPPARGPRAGPLLSLSTGTFLPVPLATVLAIARAAGVDGVELVVTPEVALRAPGSLRRTVEASGVPVLSVHPPILPVPLPGWRSELEGFRRALDLALAFPEARVVTLHTPDAASWKDREARAWLEVLAESVARTEGRALTLAVENEKETRPSHATRVLHDPSVLAAFAEELGLGITFDTGHAGSGGRDVVEAARVVRPRLVNVHLNDLRRLPPLLEGLAPGLAHALLLHHQLPGHGTLPLRETLRLLRATGYTGLITLELSPVAVGLWRPGRLVTCLQQAVAWCRAALEDEP